MWILTFILIFILISPLQATPSWESPTLHNGQLRIDGQLFKRLGLGMLNGSPEFKFPIYLEHNISKYPFGEFERFSQWSVPQLTSYVAPINGGIFWLSPGGEEYFFKSNDPTYKILNYRPNKIKGSYVAVRGNNKKEPDRIYIISKDKFVYAYDKGILKNLEAPSGRRLYFKTNGIRITDIEQNIDGEKYELLSAKYDQLNRLTSIKIGPFRHDFEYEGESEMMTSWRPFGLKERETLFIYKDGLLSAIIHPNTDKEDFTWITTLKDFELSGNRYLDNVKFKPVLLSDSDNIYNFAQEKAGIVMQKTNLLENSDKIIFNPITNRLTTIDKGGVSSSVQWGRGFQNEATNKLSEIISPKGEIIVKLEYDEEGRISQMAKRGEKPTIYKYDDQDRIVEISVGDYPATKYEYDKNSIRPTKIINSLGEITEFSYGDDKQIISLKNANNAIQKFNYDKLGRITRRNYPMGVWIAWEYDNFGRVSKREYSNRNSIKFEYDEYSQIKRVVENGKIVWEYFYQPNGMLKLLTRNKRKWLEIDSKIQDKKEYLSIINNKGAESQKTYDLDGKLLEEVNPLKDTIQYKYNPIGELTGWIAPDGSDVKFEYDARGKMVFHENHIGQTIENKYDKYGNLAEKKTKEQTIKIEYDSFDRVVKRKYSDRQITDINYDEYGRIKSIVSADVNIELEYDALGRVTKRMATFPDGSKSAVIIEYTNSGQRKRVFSALQNPDKSEKERNDVRYEYDELNRPIKMLINNGGVVRYYYDKKSQMLLSKVFPNENKNTYSYDTNFRLKTIQNYDSKDNPIGGIQYDWDTDGTLNGKKIW